MNLNTTISELSLSNNFGFTLDIHPVLNVTVSPPVNDNYDVAIASEYQVSPIANAQVDAALFFKNQGIIAVATASNTTGFDGKCSLQFLNSQPGILTVSVTYLGIHMVQVFDFGNNVKADLLGDVMLLNPAYAARTSNITEVIATKQVGRYVIGWFNSSASVDGTKYAMSFSEPSAFAFVTFSSDGSTLIYASRNINVTYSTIPSLGTSNSFALLSYSLERTVMIRDATCTVRLLLWRMTY